MFQRSSARLAIQIISLRYFIIEASPIRKFLLFETFLFLKTLRQVDDAEKAARKAEYHAKAAAEEVAAFLASENAGADSLQNQQEKDINALVEASKLAEVTLAETASRTAQIVQAAERNGLLARAVICRVERDLQGSCLHAGPFVCEVTRAFARGGELRLLSEAGCSPPKAAGK